MTTPVIPLLVGGKKGKDKASGFAERALLGDIYTRRWTSIERPYSISGKKKKPREVDHELKLNAASIGIGALGVGACALGAGLGLWLMQRRVTLDSGKIVRRTAKLHWNKEKYDTPHEDPNSYWVVYSERGIPMKRHRSDAGPFEKEYMLTTREKNLGPEEMQYESQPGFKRYKVRLKGKRGLKTLPRKAFTGFNLGGGDTEEYDDEEEFDETTTVPEPETTSPPTIIDVILQPWKYW